MPKKKCRCRLRDFCRQKKVKTEEDEIELYSTNIESDLTNLDDYADIESQQRQRVPCLLYPDD